MAGVGSRLQRVWRKRPPPRGVPTRPVTDSRPWQDRVGVQRGPALASSVAVGELAALEVAAGLCLPGLTASTRGLGSAKAMARARCRAPLEGFREAGRGLVGPGVAAHVEPHPAETAWRARRLRRWRCSGGGWYDGWSRCGGWGRSGRRRRRAGCGRCCRRFGRDRRGGARGSAADERYEDEHSAERDAGDRHRVRCFRRRFRRA